MKKDNIKLSIFWIFSFIVIIFMMTFSSHAEEPNQYFPMLQNQNGTLPSQLDDILNSNYSNVNGFLLKQGGSTSWDFYFVVFCETDPIYAEIRTNGYQFDLYSPGTIKQHRIVLKKSDNSLVEINTSGYSAGISGLDSSIYNSNVSYLSNHKIYTANNEMLVLKYGTDPIVNIGVAIIPPEALTPEYPNGLTAPDTVPPQVTINNYSWTNQPAFDNSSVINGIESIKDTLVWLATNIHGEISNLLSNLKSLFDYVSETFQYYGNMIIETLNNMLQNFYDNMQSLVEGIFNQVEYIKQPLDQDVIWDNISTTSLVTNVNTINTSLTSFQAAFNGVNEPNEYKIPIHLENLPSSWFGTQTTQYIDLGVVNGTVKDGLRLFVWAMVTYGLVVTIFDSISNYINGGGDES